MRLGRTPWDEMQIAYIYKALPSCFTKDHLSGSSMLLPSRLQTSCCWELQESSKKYWILPAPLQNQHTTQDRLLGKSVFLQKSGKTPPAILHINIISKRLSRLWLPVGAAGGWETGRSGSTRFHGDRTLLPDLHSCLQLTGERWLRRNNLMPFS